MGGGREGGKERGGEGGGSDWRRPLKAVCSVVVAGGALARSLGATFYGLIVTVVRRRHLPFSLALPPSLPPIVPHTPSVKTRAEREVGQLLSNPSPIETVG